MKLKYIVTTTVVDTVPAGGEPLKLKTIKDAVSVALAAGSSAQLSLGKVKVMAAV